jgi:hypothetical protein
MVTTSRGKEKREAQKGRNWPRSRESGRQNVEEHMKSGGGMTFYYSIA